MSDNIDQEIRAAIAAARELVPSDNPQLILRAVMVALRGRANPGRVLRLIVDPKA